MFLTTCVIFISYKVPQEMFKNVPQVKTKCGDKNQVKHLLNVTVLRLSDQVFYY